MAEELKQPKIEDLKAKEMGKEADQVKGGFGPIDSKTGSTQFGPIDGSK